MKEKQNSFGFNVESRLHADDPPMFDQARARKTDPVTSHEAAEKITPHLGTIDDTIYKALLEVGEMGATSDQIVKMTGIKYRSVTPRLKPMCKKGLVVDSGECRNGDSGRQQIIWRAKGSNE
jgi:hypothetical protein